MTFKKASCFGFILSLIILSSYSYSSGKAAKLPKEALLFRSFKRMLPAIADKIVLTGSFAVYLYSREAPEGIVTAKEKAMLLQSIEDFDFIVDEPKTHGKIALLESLEDHELTFNEQSDGTLVIEGIRIDLLRTSKAKLVGFSSYYSNTPTITIPGVGSFHIESTKNLLRRYELYQDMREGAKQDKDSFKMKTLKKIIATSSGGRAGDPKTVKQKIGGRKKFIRSIPLPAEDMRQERATLPDQRPRKPEFLKTVNPEPSKEEKDDTN